MSLLWSASPATAQEQEAPPEPAPAAAAEQATDPDLITITATKTRRHTDFVPAEVSIVTQDELELRQAQDLLDIVRYTPGVQVIGQTRQVGQKPVIRGFSDERVLVNIDGGRMTFDSGHKGQVFFDPDWLSRVEIVRGAGSSLYGSNAIGGVFSMQTIDPHEMLGPDDVFGVRQKFSFQGNNQELGSTTTLAGRATRDIEYLFGYSQSWAMDNYQLGGDAGEVPFSDEDARSGLAKLVWHASDFDRFELSYWAYELEGITPSNTSSIAPNQTSSPAVDRQTFQQSVRLGYEHNDPTNAWVDLHANFYFNDLTIEESQVAGGQEDKVDFFTLGLDLRNTSTFEWGDRHSLALTYGFEFFRDDQESTRNGGPLILFPEAVADHYAGYIQAELGLWDRLLTLAPGVRYDAYDLQADGQPDKTEGELSPKVSALVTLDDELKLREGDYVVLEGSYGEGFRAPSFNELFIAGPHFTIPGLGTAAFVPNPDLDPETSQTIEAGLRANFGDVRGRAAVFRTEAEDFIETQQITQVPFPGSPVGNYQARNVSEATIEGLELSAQWQLTERTRVWGNYTYLDGENETANQPLLLPPDNASLGIDHLIDQMDLTLGLRVRIYDGQDDAPPGGFEASGYTLYDFVSSWQPSGPEYPGWVEGLRVGVAVENLTDKEYSWFNGEPGRGINPAVTVSYTKTW